jgi:SAM-dependent methyltransferase
MDVMLLLDIIFLCSVIVLLLGIFFLLHILVFGAPYEPSHKKELDDMLKLLSPKINEKIADLGSGDGKVVIALAKAGAEAHGYEINPLLVLLSRIKIKKARLGKKAKIHWQNFWNAPLKNYDAIIFFQTKYIMEDLENKLKDELRAEARVVSNTWKFPNINPEKKNGRALLYRMKKSISNKTQR